MKDKLFNYVYEITYKNGQKYIGVRSCNCPIEEDSYMGSPFHLPEELKGTGNKVVLSTHSSRTEAMEEEIRLHALYDVKNNESYINQCNATSTKFQVSEEALKRGAIARTGRTKESHEYIAKQVEARSKYKGDGLTEAQKAQWSAERMAERMDKYCNTLANTLKDPTRAKEIHEARVRGGKSCTGIPNPKKGHVGNKHPKAFIWWYIKPGSDKIVVNDSVRNYCTNNPNEFPFSSASVMRFLRDNHIPDKLSKLGWQFGKVDNEE